MKVPFGIFCLVGIFFVAFSQFLSFGVESLFHDPPPHRPRSGIEPYDFTRMTYLPPSPLTIVREALALRPPRTLLLARLLMVLHAHSPAGPVPESLQVAGYRDGFRLVSQTSFDQHDLALAVHLILPTAPLLSLTHRTVRLSEFVP